MKRRFSDDESRYNAEFLLCDEFYEFHRDIFSVLTIQERKDLFTYYPQDLARIHDVFDYRIKVLETDPQLAARAHAALALVLEPIGVRLPEG